MKIEKLSQLVEDAAKVYMGLPRSHSAYFAAYTTWHMLDQELTEAESKEGS